MNGSTNLNNIPTHSGSQLRPRQLLVTLLIIAIFLAEAMAVAAGVFVDPAPPSPTSLLLIGLALGNMGLAGFYLALGRQSLFVRCLVATGFALTGGILGAAGEGSEFKEAGPIWCGVAMFNTFLIAVPIVYLWARGLRLIHPDDGPPKPPAPRKRFSLWGAMTVMTCAAILLAVARNLQFPIDAVSVVMLFAVASGVIVLVAAAALLGPLRILTSLACLGGAALACAVPLTWVRPSISLWEAVVLMLVQGALAAAVMLTLRAAGYRLRWPVYEYPVVKETPTPANDSQSGSAVAAVKHS